MPGWDAPGFDAAGWLPVRGRGRQSAMCRWSRRSTRRCGLTEELPAQVGDVSRRPARISSIWGRTWSAGSRLKVQGPAGTVVRLRFGEILQPDGSLYVANLRAAKATDTYILKGGGPETFEPHFTFHGFRYVEVTGYPGEPGLDAVTGCVLHSDIPKTGTFECDNALVNQLVQNIDWGQRGNFLSIPTDCPQRDERLGWMGDAQIFVRTAAGNRDVAAFFTKWMDDVVDAQSPEGGFPDVAPRLVDLSDGAPAWGDAGRDRAVDDLPGLRRHAAFWRRITRAMARWIEYLSSANPDHAVDQAAQQRLRRLAFHRRRHGQRPCWRPPISPMTRR